MPVGVQSKFTSEAQGQFAGFKMFALVWAPNMVGVPFKKAKASMMRFNVEALSNLASNMLL